MMVSGQEIVTDTVLDASLSDSLEVTQALGEASSVTAGLDVSYVALETALQTLCLLSTRPVLVPSRCSSGDG